MRHWINLVESTIPAVVYHGTCVSKWETVTTPQTLYVTTNRETAIHYAREWAEVEEQPLLVEVPLAYFSEDRFDANDETLQQHEEGHVPINKSTDEIGWRDCMEFNSTFVIRYFSENDKKLCRVVPISA